MCWDRKSVGITVPVLQISIIKPRVSRVALVVKNPPANAGDARDMGSVPG